MVRGVKRAAIIVALALPLGAAARQSPSLGSADNGQIAVGMACSDGTFTPLASWDGRAWRSLLRELEAVSFFAALTPEAQRLPRLGWTFFPNGAERRLPAPDRYHFQLSSPGLSIDCP